ncbi:MAG TPA: hypothetical protein VMF58_15780 [Rhizomicrobium sp.]|nr:hypothetical protein [Rhizomicrobium sp.]
MTENSFVNKAVKAASDCREVSARHADGDLIIVRMAADAEVAALHEMTIREIGPSVASFETMKRVYKHNPECLWSIYRQPLSEAPEFLAGYFGFLHLNAAGLVALNERTLSGREPDLALLAGAGERPAALYVWAAVARKIRMIAEMLVAQALGAERYGGLPVYATAGTLGGLKWLNHLGEADRGPQENALGNVFRVDLAKSVASRVAQPPQSATIHRLK